MALPIRPTSPSASILYLPLRPPTRVNYNNSFARSTIGHTLERHEFSGLAN